MSVRSVGCVKSREECGYLMSVRSVRSIGCVKLREECGYLMSVRSVRCVGCGYLMSVKPTRRVWKSDKEYKRHP